MHAGPDATIAPPRRTGPILVVARTVALTISVTLTIAGCSLFDPREAAPGESATPIDPTATTAVELSDRWTVSVPPGATPPGAEMLVDRTRAGEASAPWSADGRQVLDTADVSLTSGQPRAPLTFTFRLDQPLPENQVLYLVDDTADAAGTLAQTAGDADTPTATSVLVAEMNADRTVGTVTTTHLSLKTWLLDVVGATTATIGRLIGQRHDPPECTRARPEWMVDEPVYLDDINGPQRVCVEADPNDPATAVVKIANNRGGALLVTSPVSPSWAWQSMFGSEVQQWAPQLIDRGLGALGVTASERSRTWVLPPGTQVHIGISQDMVADRSPLTIRSRMTPLSTAWGVGSSLFSAGRSVRAAGTPADVALTAWQLAVLATCAQGVAAVGSGGELTDLGEATLQLARCTVEQPEAITALLIDQLGPASWNTIRSQVVRLAASAKFVLGPLLAVGAAAFVTTDLITTMQATDGAWTVALFAPVRRAPQPGSFTLGLGGTIGDQTVFADGEETIALAVASLGPPDSDSGWIPPECGPVGEVRWRLVRWGAFELLITDAAIPQPDGTSGAPIPHVAGWTYYAEVPPASPVLRTAEGLTIGSTRAAVEAAYPGELGDGPASPFAGGSLSVFRGDFSNITFDLDERDQVVMITSGQGGCGD